MVLRALVRRTGVWLAVVASLATSAGCGAAKSTSTTAQMSVQPPSAAALASVLSAARKTVSSTAKYSMKMSNATALGGSASASGFFDFKASQGTMTLQNGSSGGTEQIVFTANDLYIRSSGTPTASGKPWILAAFDAADAPAEYRQLIFEAEAIDPGFTLNQLTTGLVSAAAAGQVKVNGELANRYVVTVDLNRAKSNSAGAAAPAYLDGLSTESGASPSPSASPAQDATVKMVVSIGSEGYVVAVEVTPPRADLGDLSLNLSNFGTPVPVQLPPQQQTTTVSHSLPSSETSTTEPAANGPGG